MPKRVRCSKALASRTIYPRHLINVGRHTYHALRVKLSRIIIDTAESGRIDLTIEGFYVPDSRVIRLENITIQ